MPDDDAARSCGDDQSRYEIVQSDSDPNRPWQLVGWDPAASKYFHVGFRTYGDAWQAVQERKANASGQGLIFPGWDTRPRASGCSEYATDRLAWSNQQAALLQRLSAGKDVLGYIDWENVIEEVQSAGRRQLAEVKTLLVQALALMLKARAWPASPEVPHWQIEASGFQREAAATITPRMRAKLDMNSFYFKAIRLLPKSVGGEAPLPFPPECPLTLEELLDD
jgi:hypothetical protein